MTLITFTVKAAEQLRFRLAARLDDPRLVADVYIGTIHGFCRYLLNTFSPEFGEIEVLSEIQQLALLSVKRNEWNIRAIEPTLFDNSKGAFFRAVAEAINRTKQEAPDEALLAARHPEFVRVLTAYNQHLRQTNRADFADLLLLSLTLLRSSSAFLAAARRRAAWLFVDEYQDVDPSQHDLICLLAQGGQLCVIGDDDQSIYRFRGTDPAHFIERAQPKRGRDVVLLPRNFRSRDAIVKAAATVANRIRPRLTKTMESEKRGGFIHKDVFPDIRAEATFIAEEIRRLHDIGLVQSLSQVAILLRSIASYGEAYLTVLADHNIPCTTRGDRGLIRQPAVESVRGVLDFLTQESEDASGLSVLRSPLGEATDKLAAAAVPWPELTDYDLATAGLDATGIGMFREWGRIRSRYRSGRFGALLELVLDVIASFHVLRDDRGDTALENLCKLTQLVAEFESVARTRNIRFLSGFLSMHADYLADEAEPIDAIEAVNVLTVHQSKGLEFSAVFLPMLCEGRFPVEGGSDRKLLDPTLFSCGATASLADERRLFYVALTRAADRLYLSCPRDVGLKNPKNPSSFFLEVPATGAAPAYDRTGSSLSLANEAAILTTSYSDIELYLSCPYRYWLARMAGLAVPPKPFFEFGRSIHAALRELHIRHADHGPLTLAEIEHVYRDKWRITGGVPAAAIEPKRIAGLAAVHWYYNSHREWMSRTHATELPFEYCIDGVVLRGRLDLVLNSTCGGKEIVDFKTGTAKEYIDTDFQMALYALVGREHFGWMVHDTQVLYVEQRNAEVLSASTERVDSAAAKLSSTAHRIRGGEFDATPGAVCTRCEYRKLCPHAAGRVK